MWQLTSDTPAQAMIHVDWNDLARETCNLTDQLCGTTYSRSGDVFLSCGLYVDLGPWNSHVFRCEVASHRSRIHRHSWTHH